MSQSSSEVKMCPNSFKECFYFDESLLNPTPKRFLWKISGLYLNTRWSMCVLMRLTQLFYMKYEKSKGLRRRLYRLLSVYLAKRNLVLNNFEHGLNPKIAAGVVFHHPGVTITSEAVLERGVHLYRNVTIGSKRGAPYIKQGAKIASHSVVLGPITIGERAIVAPGSVVAINVPDQKIAGGVPAKIIGDVNESNYEF